MTSESARVKLSEAFATLTSILEMDARLTVSEMERLRASLLSFHTAAIARLLTWPREDAPGDHYMRATAAIKSVRHAVDEAAAMLLPIATGREGEAKIGAAKRAIHIGLTRMIWASDLLETDRRPEWAPTSDDVETSLFVPLYRDSGVIEPFCAGCDEAREVPHTWRECIARLRIQRDGESPGLDLVGT